MDFFLHVCSLFWSLHSSPSISKRLSIIPIHKMGKPLDSPASFWAISLTSCIAKLFEHIILSCLLFFLESNTAISLPAWLISSLNKLFYIEFFILSISDGFNKPKQGSQTILATIDFSKAFNSVWHPALFQKPISTWPPCLDSIFPF